MNLDAWRSRSQSDCNGEAGFTLIEALVALSILAVSACALMGAAGADIRRVSDLEDRAAAQLVAENQLVEWCLAKVEPTDTTDRVQMGFREWDVTTTTTATSDPDLFQAKITVSRAGDNNAIVTMQGFVDGASSHDSH